MTSSVRTELIVTGSDAGAGRMFEQLTDVIDRLARRLDAFDSTSARAEVDLDTSRAERAMDDVADSGRQAGEEAGDGVAEGFAAKAAAIGAAAIAVGGALVGGITAAMDRESIGARIQAQLGGGAEGAANFGRIAGSLYAGNFGGSLGEVSDAVVTVHQTIGESMFDTDEALQSATGTVLSLADAFGVDLAESTLAVGSMVRTGMAPDVTAALDLVTYGLQNGLDKAGDFVGTMAESSGIFQRFGLDGREALGLMQQGFAAGAPSAEFFVGMLEELAGNAGDSAEVFDTLGLNGVQMGADLSAGGERASVALDMLLDALRNTEDPSVRATALVGLFGEEAAAMQQVLMSIDPSAAVEGLGNVAGSAERMTTALGDTAAGRIESLRRSLETGLVDFIGGALLPALDSVTAAGASMFGEAWEPVKSFLGYLAGTGGVVITAIAGIALATWGWTAASAALAAATFPISGTMLIIIGVIAGLVAAVLWAWNNFEGFRNVVTGAWAAIQVAFQVAWTVLSAVFNAMVAAVTNTAAFFSNAWNTIATTTSAIWSGIGSFLTNTWNTIVAIGTAIFTGYYNFYAGIWNAVTSVTSAIWNGIVSFLQGTWNLIATIAMTVWNGIGNYFTSLFNAHRELINQVWTNISNFLSTIWNAIASFAQAIWNGITAYFTNTWNMWVTIFTTVWNAISSVATTIWNAISAFFSAAFNVFSAMFSAVWNGVSATFSAVWNQIFGVAQAVWSAISNYFTTMLNAYVQFWSGVWNNVSAIFGAAWNGIRSLGQTLWNGIAAYFTGALGTFQAWWSGVWNSVVSGFEAVWGRVRSMAQSVWDGVVGIFRGGVNSVIDALNWLSSKVNIVLKFLLIPQIPAIPRLEAGGVIGGGGGGRVQMLAEGGRVGGGFTTNGPMAIVGEGNPAYPEYVIPTDPKYRDRARGLYDSLGISLMEEGGVLGWIGDAAGAVGRGVSSIAGSVGSAISDAARWVGGGAAGLIGEVTGAIRGMLPSGVMGDVGMGLVRKALDAIKAMIDKAFAAQTASGVGADTGAIGTGGGGAGWQWQMNVLRQAFPGLALISGFRPGAITATGNRSYHAQGRAVDIPPRMDVFNWIRATYGANTKELIFSPAGGAQVWNGKPHVYTGVTKSMHYDHVHWAFANGGVVMAPTFGLVGEAGPEAVVPLTRPRRAAEVMAAAGLATSQPDTAGVEQRLDALLDMLERRGAGATINVQDVSGDPTETARTTVLALKLA